MAPLACAIGLLTAAALGYGGAMAAGTETGSGSASQALSGAWGGDRLRLVFDADGARVETDCASGWLTGPVRPGADGRFVAFGSFESHGGGPQPSQQTAPAREARYSGEVHGAVLRLEILPAGATAPQSFELREGARVKLVRCL